MTEYPGPVALVSINQGWHWQGMNALGVSCLSAYLRQQGIETLPLHASLDFISPPDPRLFQYPRHNASLYRWFDDPEALDDEERAVVEGGRKRLALTLQLLERRQPWVVGISIHVLNVFPSLLLAREIRRRLPGTPIVFGGPECNEDNRAAFVEEGFCDAVIVGEGEEQLHRYLLGLKGGNSAGEVGPPPPLAMDDLPTPDHAWLAASADRERTSLPFAFNRGCIFRCAFCNEAKAWGRYRQMSPETAVRQMLELQDRHGIGRFFMTQSLMNGDLDHLAAVARGIENSGRTLLWGGNCAIRREMDDDYLRALFRGGCRFMLFGIESGAPATLKAMRKGHRPETARKVLAAAHRAGIWVHTYWIFGFPGESADDLRQTLRFMIENSPHIDSYAVHPYQHFQQHIPQPQERSRLSGYLRSHATQPGKRSDFYQSHPRLFRQFLRRIHRFESGDDRGSDEPGLRRFAGAGAGGSPLQRRQLLAMHLLLAALNDPQLVPLAEEGLDRPRFDALVGTLLAEGNVDDDALLDPDSGLIAAILPLLIAPF